MLEDTQIFAILSLFEDTEETIELKDLLKLLKKESGYKKPNQIIRDAILQELLYVDAIEEDGSVMLGLTVWGEQLWGETSED